MLSSLSLLSSICTAFTVETWPMSPVDVERESPPRDCDVKVAVEPCAARPKSSASPNAELARVGVVIKRCHRDLLRERGRAQLR